MSASNPPLPSLPQHPLPCPFCGDKEVTAWCKPHENWYGVTCIACPGCIPPVYRTEAEAIEAWNRRPKSLEGSNSLKSSKGSGGSGSATAVTVGLAHCYGCGFNNHWTGAEPPACPKCGVNYTPTFSRAESLGESRAPVPPEPNVIECPTCNRSTRHTIAHFEKSAQRRLVCWECGNGRTEPAASLPPLSQGETTNE